jgi:hypothetical protein
VQWCAGFEAGDANELVGVAGSVSVIEAAARTGRYGVRIAPPAGGDSAYITLANTLTGFGTPSVTSRSAYVLGFAFRVVAPPTAPGTWEYLLYIANYTQHRASLSLSGEGRLALRIGAMDAPVSATFGPVVPGRWHYCELAVLADSFVWRMDGQLVATGAAAPGGIMNRAYLGKRIDLQEQGYTLDVDDLYTETAPDFLGPTARVLRLAPNADGETVAWVRHGIGLTSFWQHLADVPHDGDVTYVSKLLAAGTFGVGFEDIALQAGEQIAAVTAAVVWRSTTSANGSAYLRVGDHSDGAGGAPVSTSYDTAFVLSRLVPGTSRKWTKADVDAVVAGAAMASGTELCCTQIGLHVLLYAPPAATSMFRFQRKDTPMNFVAMEPLVASGSDQPIEVPRGATLLVHPLEAGVEVRDRPGATAKLTITAGSLVPLGPSLGQKVYLRATAGTTIELALT